MFRGAVCDIQSVNIAADSYSAVMVPEQRVMQTVDLFSVSAAHFTLTCRRRCYRSRLCGALAVFLLHWCCRETSGPHLLSSGINISEQKRQAAGRDSVDRTFKNSSFMHWVPVEQNAAACCRSRPQRPRFLWLNLVTFSVKFIRNFVYCVLSLFWQLNYIKCESREVETELINNFISTMSVFHFEPDWAALDLPALSRVRL